VIPAIVGFDWDGGNREKCQKHGLTIAVIENLLRSPLGVFPDPQHSKREERFKAIGRTEDRAQCSSCSPCGGAMAKH